MTAQAAAHEDLHWAIRAAEETRHTIPCRVEGGSDWISEDTEDQKRAKTRCRSCPVFAACKTAGSYERAGVWAGDLRSNWKYFADEREREQGGQTDLLTELNENTD